MRLRCLNRSESGPPGDVWTLTSVILCVCVCVCVPAVYEVQITIESYDRPVAPVSAGLDRRQGRDGGREEGKMAGEAD